MDRILIAEDDRTTRAMLREVLKQGGFSVVTAADGKAALRRLRQEKFALLLLDIWMPRMSGLDLLALLGEDADPPRVIVMTSDETPSTLLTALRQRVYQYVTKPVEANALLDLVRDALKAQPSTPPIEVLSAKPTWVELLVPCERSAADRVQSFLMHLDSDLEPEIRQSVGQAFRELLQNAIEWGGKLDPNLKVRISCVRASHMLMYRISDPGPGFRFEELKHAAVSNPAGQPIAHAQVREEMGLRPGGLGILMSKAMVDELIYNEAQNEVVLVKYLK